MQRWIYMGLAACIIGGIVLVSGAWFYRQNKPCSQWVPIPLTESSTMTEREELRQHLAESLQKPEMLSTIVKELDLPGKLDAPSQEEAIAKLQAMMFIRLGEFQNPTTMVQLPTVDVGVEGKRKQQALLGEIAVKLGEKSRTIMGYPGAK